MDGMARHGMGWDGMGCWLVSIGPQSRDERVIHGNLEKDGRSKHG